MPFLPYWYSIQIQADFLNGMGVKEWCFQEIRLPPIS